ncbi:rod shape-determining protein MreD [Seongchinamella unica]|uniref:Rod shape-determining protein MreD n=1 Tax=Seongchinamella unica TaxID=2547392 RepID=A0A4R5LTU8_9GAMM|nr:rod shape-determining protein MreD [Seongchinamella unica]TDG14780.1 rod shape-determining protein MreD [Seongchinamella unica]
MVDQGPHGYWLILASFFCALCLAVLPLPQWLAWGRPEWVALVLIYWVIALPHRVGLVTALGLGLMFDVVEGAVMGQNAFALVVIALLALLLYQRLRVFSVIQQSGVVFVLVGINQMICQWVQNLEGAGATTMLFLLPAFSSALLWPFVLHLLRGMRRSFRVT